MSGFGSRPTAGLIPVADNRRALADALMGIPARIGGAFTNMATQGLQANERFMSGEGANQPFLPSMDSGGRVGELASFLSSNMAMGGPAGSLGAGPSIPKRYEYAMMYRPPSHATVPAGFKEFGPPTRENPFGTVVYEKPPGFKAEEAFELRPLDPAHPKNKAKEFNDWKQKFMDDFSSANERYKGEEFVVNPSTSTPGAWQLTTFSRRDDGGLMPGGHIDISDFDELAREVFGQIKMQEYMKNRTTPPRASALANALSGEDGK